MKKQVSPEYLRLYQLTVLEIERAKEALRAAQNQSRVIELEIRIRYGLGFEEDINWDSGDISGEKNDVQPPVE